jgi:DDE superfamily endonuclease
LTPLRQAVLVLRWFREHGCVHCLARDARISQTTGYRCLHEGIDVLADKAPDLHEVLEQCQRDGITHLILDGTLITSDRVAATTPNGNDLWYRGKRKTFGGNIQFLAMPDGTPLWISEVELGTVKDSTAAGKHVLGALYPASHRGLPTLANSGYQGAGIGVHTRSRNAGVAHMQPSTSTPAPTTSSCVGCGHSGNVPPPSSRNAGGPSSTSPSVPAESGRSRKRHSLSTLLGNDSHRENLSWGTIPAYPVNS